MFPKRRLLWNGRIRQRKYDGRWLYSREILFDMMEALEASCDEGGVANHRACSFQIAMGRVKGVSQE